MHNQQWSQLPWLLRKCCTDQQKRAALYKHCIMNKQLLNSYRDQANLKNCNIWKNTIVNRYNYKELELKKKKKTIELHNQLERCTEFRIYVTEVLVLRLHLGQRRMTRGNSTTWGTYHILLLTARLGRKKCLCRKLRGFYIPWGPLNLIENYFFVTKWRKERGDLKWLKKKKKKKFTPHLHSCN